MQSKIPKLSTELYDRLYEALLSCEEFESNVRLQAIIANGELAVYSRWFLEHEPEARYAYSKISDQTKIARN